ncbi:hypothetical protein EV196_108241 [Mariniflexile fucanivorans]|uniref:Uncharacterized protein n=1 Tax=Mariniflexile fucanivorans TaxID=264023 RepID=A0A4R1RDU7_9FLAO|nr:hypothetical protein [Mariniflexile fucanivorans]TCL64041.1 hypothetical protein EV196_108241 [Mariniflexile fucanivorans]
MKTKKKDLKRLLTLAKYQLVTLKPSNVKKDKFKPTFLQFEGYKDLFITIESLINVCIMASHIENSTIPEDHGLDIRKTLELANQLLPFDEGEFLDNVNTLIKQIEPES